MDGGFTYFIGPVKRPHGRAGAAWFARRFPADGKVAIVEGQAGVFSTVMRTSGFRSVMAASGRFEIVGSVSGDWDRHKAFEAAMALMRQHPDLLGIYCNNDIMALGAVEAADALHLLDKVRVFGAEGTSEAYAWIMANRLRGPST